MIFNTVILGGAGGGSIIEAKAIGETVSFTEGDKVLLTPTADLFDSTMYSYEANLAGTRTEDVMFGPVCLGTSGILDYDYVTAFPGIYNRTTAPSCFGLRWNDSKSSLTGSVGTASDSNIYVCVNYEGVVPFAITVNGFYSGIGRPSYQRLGIRQNGVFIDKMAYESDVMNGLTVVDKFFKTLNRSWKSNLFYLNEQGSIITLTGTNGNCIPSKYNGTWYFVKGGNDGVTTLTDTSTNVFTISGMYTYTDGITIRFFDSSVDYFWEKNFNASPRVWELRKIVKGPTAWTVSSIPASAAYQECLRNSTEWSNDNWQICNKDHGDHVETFLSSTFMGYDPVTGAGNKVAHLIFDKATETVTRLPDVFMEIPDEYTHAGQLQVNWELGLISICASYRISDSGGDHCAIFVKKFNDLAKIYKYNAYENSKGYYYKDTITGFVKENKGVNARGDTVLSVETTEDPNAAPWVDEGVVFGMNVTVNEGDPT